MPAAGVARPVLAVEGERRIEHAYETATLAWNGGSIAIGDHYGDPDCAVINVEGGWCVTGGEGLVVCHFEGGLPAGPAPYAATRLTILELWRRGNPPPSGPCWSVEGA